MLLRRLALGLAALFLFGGAHALAQPSGISQKVAVCDPKTAANCIKPAADGSIAVTGGTGGGAPYTAAAAPFSVSAGTNKPAGIDTANSAQFTEICVPGTTTCVDPTSPASNKGVDGTTIMSSFNPFGVGLYTVNGNAVTSGNGTAGTGSQRITIASDNSPVSGLGVGATGTSPPGNAVYAGGQGSSGLRGLITCDQHAFYDASDNGKKTVVAGTSAKKTYICGYTLATGGTATNLSLTSGTGTDCVTTSTAITPAYQLVANDRVGFMSAFWTGLITLANADNLCVNASAGNAHQVEIWYAQL